MTFTTTKLTGQRVLVKGQDIAGTMGSTVLDSSQWEEINSHGRYHEALETFDAEVAEFFAPINKASEKFEAAHAAENVEDSIGYVVLHEGTEGTQAQPEQRVELHNHSIVLRILESGDTSRLVWVNDELEVIAAQATTQAAPIQGQTVGQGTPSF